MERRLKHRDLPEFRGRKHQTVTKRPFSPPSFPARRKRRGRRRRVRNDHDGTNPCKQGFLSSVLVSSFPNRKLNLRFWFFYANLQHPLSQPSAASIPTPFVPSGHFPLIGGIGPWKGSQGVRTARSAAEVGDDLSVSFAPAPLGQKPAAAEQRRGGVTVRRLPSRTRRTAGADGPGGF